MISKVNSFVRQCLTVEREDAGECHRFVLKHVNANAKQNEVGVFDARPIHKANGDKRDDFIESLVREIEERAHDDAESLGGHQRYLLFAYHKGHDKPLGRCGFRMEGSGDDDDDEMEGTEPANAKGLVAQTMRHMESIMRSSVMSTNHMMAMQQRTIETLSEQNGRLLEDKFKTLDLVEDLISRKKERELMENREALHQKFKEEGFKKISLLLPAVVNRVAGKKVLSEPLTPEKIALQEFAHSLSQEQLLALSNVLRPDQMIAVGELLKSVISEDEETKPNGKDTVQ